MHFDSGCKVLVSHGTGRGLPFYFSGNCEAQAFQPSHLAQQVVT